MLPASHQRLLVAGYYFKQGNNPFTPVEVTECTKVFKENGGIRQIFATKRNVYYWLTNVR